MVCVIGDIHGSLHTLLDLVHNVKQKYPAVPMYSVGDLVDGGKFSCDVVDYVSSGNIQFTPGNHDYMFLQYQINRESPFAKKWAEDGYDSAMPSYKGKEYKIKTHTEEIAKAPLFINTDDCFISHAGISSVYEKDLPAGYKSDPESMYPFIREKIEDEHGILLTRDELLDLGKLQVVGHTRKENVYHDKKNNALYIDTSIYAGKNLSAVLIHKNEIIDIFTVPARMEDFN